MLKKFLLILGVIFLACGCTPKAKKIPQIQMQFNERQVSQTSHDPLMSPDHTHKQVDPTLGHDPDSPCSVSWEGWTMGFQDLKLVVKKEFIWHKIRHTFQAKRGLYDDGVISYQLSFSP